LEILNSLKFEFPEITKAHAEQLRPDLIFRHSLPFCITEDSFFEPDSSSGRVLAALLAGHTLALTHLDYHLDGSSPNPYSEATARKMSAAIAAVYSARMIYESGKILSAIGGIDWLFRDVLEPVSGFVVLRMHKDWSERYSEVLLKGTSEQLEEYLYSPMSRLLGSGYWEVMVRGSFASHSSSPPGPLLQSIQQLRKLRQIVDDIADFDEDLRAGLVTTPLLFALQNSQHRERLSDAVRSLWHSREIGAADSTDAMVAEVRSLVTSSAGFDESSRLANTIWEDGAALCERHLGRHATGYVALLDLKRAKLEQLAGANWRSETTDPIFI
jgi:hypothetical protein